MNRLEHERLLRCALPHRMANSLAAISGLLSLEAAPATQVPTGQGLARVSMWVNGSSGTIARLETLDRQCGSGKAAHPPVEVMGAPALQLPRFSV